MRRAFSSRFTLPVVVRGLIAAGALLGSLGVLAAGCSLGNLSHDDCTDDAQCGALFGLGSTCAEGFCSDAASCNTGHECRKAAGGGACVMGACQGGGGWGGGGGRPPPPPAPPPPHPPPPRRACSPAPRWAKALRW